VETELANALRALGVQVRDFAATHPNVEIEISWHAVKPGESTR
jgi:hypothetical protein